MPSGDPGLSTLPLLLGAPKGASLHLGLPCLRKPRGALQAHTVVWVKAVAAVQEGPMRVALWGQGFRE